MINQLTVRAFKGLREFDIQPGRVNLLIGANGTGKTNFADLVDLIARLCPLGLLRAMQSFGGLSQVRTQQPRAGMPYKLKVAVRLGNDPLRGIKQVHYSFALAQSKEITVQEETLDAIVYKRSPGKPKMQGFPLFDTKQTVQLRYQRKGSSAIEWRGDLVGSSAEFDDEQELVLASYGRLGELRTVADYLSSWRVYNVDAVVAKRSTGGDDTELERYGSNIVPYVARMLSDKKIRKQLLSDLQEAVPYIRDIQPDRVLTFQTLRFEEDSGSAFQLPEMSDGTIRLLGLLAVLRQPIPPAVVVIEEPENALHAYAIHHFLDVARQAAMDDKFASQIFLTSHSPAVVDEVLGIEAMRETNSQTTCFVTRREPPTIIQAPEDVMQAIAQNLGRPSDFQREGSFGDEPLQAPLPLATQEAA